jgi:hypothetical protein
MVEVLGRGMTPILQLRPGDRVADGTEHGTRFVTQLHTNTSSQTYILPFLELTIASDLDDFTTTLTLTDTHRIIVVRHGKEQSIGAQNVVVGDEVILATASGLSAGYITAVRTVQTMGLAAPLTASGRIVVDSVLTSCFTDNPHMMESDDVKLMIYQPLIWLSEIAPEFVMKDERVECHWYYVGGPFYGLHYARLGMLWLRDRALLVLTTAVTASVAAIWRMRSAA